MTSYVGDQDTEVMYGMKCINTVRT